MAWTDYISINDFEGELDLPFNKSDVAKTKFVINEVTEDRLRWIFGDVYYDTFEAAIASDDENALKLFNGGVYEIEQGSFKFKGLKQMCLYFIYTELVKRGKATLNNVQDVSESNAILTDGVRFTNQINKMWKKGVVIHLSAYYILKTIDTVVYKHLETWAQ